MVNAYLPAGIGDLATSLADCRRESLVTRPGYLRRSFTQESTRGDSPFKLMTSLILTVRIRRDWVSKRAGRGSEREDEGQEKGDKNQKRKKQASDDLYGLFQG